MGSVPIVAGVDGCPGGWVVVMAAADRPSEASVSFRAAFAEVLELVAAASHVAVDIPIGLPARAGIGGRPADVAARARLGQRQSAVFSVPSRAAVQETDYAAACAIALSTSDPPRKIAKQTFHLFPKIREVDRIMTPALQTRVVECHPELAFWSLNGQQPLGEPKKVKSRPYPPGLALRVLLLSRAGFDAGLLEDRHFPVSSVGPDDLLDAAACCAAAIRMTRGTGVRVPDLPPLDERGLRMEIWG